MPQNPRFTRRNLLALPLGALGAAAGAQPPQTPAPQGKPASAVAAQLKEVALDPAQCWRIRDLTIVREDIKLYFTDGYMILSKPVGDRPIGAVFWGDIEGGDGELLLLPPSVGERQSLARFTGSPNLNVHFKSTMLLFTDGTAREILEWIRETTPKASAETGALLAGQYSDTLRNLAASFETRLTLDIAGKVKPEGGLFFATIGGTSLGSFDLVHDPQSFDQIVVAQLLFKDDRSYYNTWTSFPSRRVRKDPASAPPLRDFAIESVSIDATLDAALHLSAKSTLTIQIPANDGFRAERNSLAFDISQRVRVREVRVDGQPADVLQRENLRSNLLRGNDNEVFLIALANSLQPGRHTVEFLHEGDVVRQAGNGVYFVGARGTWYPHHGLQFANYELTFRHPANLTVVASGEIVEDKQEGEIRTTRHKVSTPIRIAGFNLGEYKRSVVTRGGLQIEVYANKNVEPSLAPVRPVIIPQPPPMNRRGANNPNLPPLTLPQAAPDPASQIETLANEVAEAFEYLASKLGPPPVRTLAVSPIPGAFGQGFPGLIYLSTLSYLTSRDRPQFANQGIQEVFFNDLLVAHEVAHQWWGNIVSTTGYRDEWLMESLANYSALLLLERKRGAKAVDEVLGAYREHLLTKSPNGSPIDEAGPIRLGARLETSQTPGAYRAIVYEKGTWVFHMLRKRLGDPGFFAMLSEIPRRFQRLALTTGDLQQLAAANQPKGLPDRDLDQFFSAYVEGTGIPTLHLTQKQRRSPKAVIVEAELEQSGVPANFSIDVPVEIDLGRGKAETRWIRTDGERTQVEWTFPIAPIKVTLDAKNSLLAVKR